ncbi:MAG TPA: methyltransferase domain-containing protein [Bacteroidota bacterium]|nr:methyltransferase domain-containing protein [Bacteroidota bacterium]
MTDGFVEFKKFEYEGWERLANKYEDVWSSLTRQFIPPLIQGTGVKPGMRVLDVACGPGYVAAESQRLGAHPVGIDFSGEMIRQARTRYPDIEFMRGDAELLDVPERSFDAVLMNFGILHLANPQKAIAEAYRVLSPHGKFGFTVWADPNENPGSKILSDAIAQHGTMNANLPPGPDYYLFADKELCRTVVETTGFYGPSMTFETVTVPWIVPTLNYFFEAELDAAVRTGALLRAQTPEQLSAIQHAVAEAVKPLVTRGGYAIPMAAHVISVSKDA